MNPAAGEHAPQPDRGLFGFSFGAVDEVTMNPFRSENIRHPADVRPKGWPTLPPAERGAGCH